MKTTRTLSLLSTIVIVVLLSMGCLGLGARTCGLTVSQKEGVQILRIEPSYYTVPVGDCINVYMDVQNRGNAIAKNVTATLWAHTGFARPEKQVATIAAGDLESPRLDICSEGDVYTFAWQLQAGCDPVETILAVSLDYGYESYGFATIPLASRAEYERTQGEISVSGENYPSAGPMQVKIESVQAEPVLMGVGTDSFSARITFNNIGSGLVGPKGVGELDWVLVTASGPCKFNDNRTYTTAKGESTGALPISSAPLEIKQRVNLELKDKAFVWQPGAVTLKSGKQEAMKFAYLVYDGDDLSTFVQDLCKIEVTANYHYNNVESPSKTMGVYGSPDQISNCLAETESSCSQINAEET